MPKFRKKPVVIEALRVPQDSPQGARDFIQWGRLLGWLECNRHVNEALGVDIQTPEGVMHADPGDWIIRGVKGEFYPCKPDIFAATYEEVSE